MHLSRRIFIGIIKSHRNQNRADGASAILEMAFKFVSEQKMQTLNSVPYTDMNSVFPNNFFSVVKQWEIFFISLIFPVF